LSVNQTPTPPSNSKPVCRIAGAIKKIFKGKDIGVLFCAGWRGYRYKSAHYSRYLLKPLFLLVMVCAALSVNCAALGLICAGFIFSCALLIFYLPIYLFIYFFKKERDIYKRGQVYKHLLNARVKYFLICLMRGFLSGARLIARSYLLVKILLIQLFNYLKYQVRGCAGCFAPGILLCVNRATMFTLILGVVYE